MARSRQRPAWLLWAISIVLAAVVAGWILRQAHGESGESDYWSVAVPGVLTGVGTIGLSIVTVILSYQERRRDDGLRAQNRADVEAQRQADRELAAAERRAAVDERAEREAAKVFIDIDYVTSGDPKVTVRNYSNEPIFDVMPVSGWIKATQNSDRWDVRPITPGSRLAVLAGVDRATLRVRTMKTGGTLWSPADWSLATSVSTFPIFASFVEVAWTDSLGNGWRRDGRAAPYRWRPEAPF